ncbi:MAG: hypothetical protein JXA03_10920 [Bacteroidales bacterium]|nr:hypothetical protein [Bacteroidales bacterium]
MTKMIHCLVILLALWLTSCNQGQKNAGIEEEQPGGFRKAVVEQVIQTTSYTYLKVNNSKEEQWIAIVRQEMQEGDTVYYEEGLKMTGFESPELGRTFETIFFVQNISNSPISHNAREEMTGGQPGKPVLNRLDIRIDIPEGVITIAELYANRDAYAGKTVKVKGQVVKVNTAIMERNWVHLQDGTADGQNFDLTLTTVHEPEAGDVVTYSGVLSLNKDFGYGYTYELILEEAVPEIK